MLEGLIRAGFSITGTWPMRTERSARSIGIGTNALASSIVLVCRPRLEDAPGATRRQFLTALRQELPDALRNLQRGNIAPVDLAQAAIGPGMAIYSRYSKVLESDGTPMRVRTALQLINQTLDEVLSEQEGAYDNDTRWAVAWFEQHGNQEGAYGDAETLSTAKNTAVSAMVQAGIIHAKGGKVRLLQRHELPPDWDPAKDRRLTVWEITQHLVHALDQRGESGAAEILAQVSDRGDVARDLAYRLYTTCERKGWVQDALAYNALVVAWPQITQQAGQVSTAKVLGNSWERRRLACPAAGKPVRPWERRRLACPAAGKMPALPAKHCSDMGADTRFAILDYSIFGLQMLDVQLNPKSTMGKSTMGKSKMGRGKAYICSKHCTSNG
jgi:putative DNA methylase